MLQLRDDLEAASIAPAREAGARVPVIFNAAAGTRSGDAYDAVEAVLRSARLRPERVPVGRGADLNALARDITAENPAIVVAGGGDGTISAVASALVGSDIALGVLPLGTLNHFAKDLGIPLDPGAAARTIAAGRSTRVDAGEVNGRVFLNNSSLGLYPHIVRSREEQQRRLGRGKWMALAWATWTTLRRKPFLNVRLALDGTEQQCTASFVFIGNNEYMMQGFSIGARQRLDAGCLSLYLTRRRSRSRLLMLGLRALVGRLHQADDFEAVTARSIVVETRRSHVHVALDGEVSVIETPLSYRILPGALRVLVPAPVSTAA